MNLKEFTVIFNQHLEDFEKLKQRVYDLEKQRVPVGVEASEEDLKKLSLAMHDWEVGIFKKYCGTQ